METASVAEARFGTGVGQGRLGLGGGFPDDVNAYDPTLLAKALCDLSRRACERTRARIDGTTIAGSTLLRFQGSNLLSHRLRDHPHRTRTSVDCAYLAGAVDEVEQWRGGSRVEFRPRG